MLKAIIKGLFYSMFKILEAIFIKRKMNKETDQAKKRAILGKFTSTLGMVLNIILSLAKIILGLLTGTISIVADGINNLTDSATAIVSLIGFKLSLEPADKDHPFGHQRFEYISGILVALLALVTGLILAKESIIDIINDEGIDFSRFYIMIIVLSLSILIKLWMGYFYKKVGLRIESISLKATSFDAFNDCLITASILIALIITKAFDITKLPIDGILGIGLSIFIVFNGIKLVKEAMSPLLGEAAKEDEIALIYNKILSYKGVINIHDLLIHSYGPKKRFVTCHVEVEQDMNLVDAHELADEIERDFRRDFGFDLTIHIDPVDTKDELTLKFKSRINDIIENINIEYDNKITFHDFRLIKNIDNIILEFDCINPFESKIKDDDLIEMIENKYKDNKINNEEVIFVINVDKS